MKLIIDIPEELYKANHRGLEAEELWDLRIAIKNGTPLDDLLQRLHKRISDLYNTDVTYDNGDYNTMDTPTLDKVLEYFDSIVNKSQSLVKDLVKESEEK